MNWGSKMERIEKMKIGFKFGKHTLTSGEILGVVNFNGRKYRIQKVITQEGREYVSVRLYNAKGKLIKQLFVEPEVAGSIGEILIIGGRGYEQGGN